MFYYRKKLSHFGQNVCKCRLMNTVTASFDRTVRQMTEMSQRKKKQDKVHYILCMSNICSLQSLTPKSFQLGDQ